MTLEECATACSTFVYFGVEYGGECRFPFVTPFDSADCQSSILTMRIEHTDADFKKATVETRSKLDRPCRPSLTVISSVREAHMNTAVQVHD
jgi:hypothetical protein